MLVSESGEQDERVYVARSKNGEARYFDMNAAGLAFFASQKLPMDAACEAAGVEGVTFPILRHKFASHAVFIEVLAKQLDHKDTRITSRHYGAYARRAKLKLCNAMRRHTAFEGNRSNP
jgi:integrase